MFDREKWGEVFEGIGKNKLRAVLTGFPVYWSNFMLTMLLGTGSWLRKGSEYMFRNTATNSNPNEPTTTTPNTSTSLLNNATCLSLLPLPLLLLLRLPLPLPPLPGIK